MAGDFFFAFFVSFGAAASPSRPAAVSAEALGFNCSALTLGAAPCTAPVSDVVELLELDDTALLPLLVLLFPFGVAQAEERSGEASANFSTPSAINCCSWLWAADCSFLAALLFLDALRPDFRTLQLPPLLQLGAGSAEAALLLRSTGALLERDLERVFLFAFVVVLV